MHGSLAERLLKMPEYREALHRQALVIGRVGHLLARPRLQAVERHPYTSGGGDGAAAFKEAAVDVWLRVIRAGVFVAVGQHRKQAECDQGGLPCLEHRRLGRNGRHQLRRSFAQQCEVDVLTRVVQHVQQQPDNQSGGNTG